LSVNILPIREIHFYKLPSGEAPIEEFLNSLTSKQAPKENPENTQSSEIVRIAGLSLEDIQKLRMQH
jgi:hypothetical protein